MQTEVYNAAGNIGGAAANVSPTAKSALQAAQTQDQLVNAKILIDALVKQGKIKVTDNLHKLLGQVNPQFNAFGPPAGSNGNPTVVHNFDTLQIFAVKLS